MSLKAFHVVFISASTLLAFGFAVYCLRAQPPDAGAGWIVAGTLSILAGLSLTAYEAWFLKKMRRLP